MTLIFTNQFDISTTEVIQWLNHYSEEVIRINFEENKYRIIYVSENEIILEDDKGNTLNILEATSYWYRRGGLNDFIINCEIEKAVAKKIFIGQNNADILRRHINAQKESLINYLFWKLETTIDITLGTYFNADLNRLILCEIVKRNGIKVPEFNLVTNTNQIHTLLENGKKLVSKSIENGIYVTSGNKAYYSYTEELNRKSLQHDTNIMQSLIMEKIEKKFEIRSFYLEGKFYSMAIFSQNNVETVVDFRKYSSKLPNRNEPFQLPHYIEVKLQAVFSELKLNTGSVDLILDLNNEYVFLEINPVGQFGMVSRPCNYNLEKIVALHLLNK